MKSTRLSLEQILAIGNVRCFDGDGGTATGDGEGGGTDGGTGGAGTEGDGAGGTGDGDSSSDEDLQKKLRNREEQAARQDREIRRLKDAERERDELKAKQEELDRKSKSELENAKADLEAERKRTADLTDKVKRLTIENAFVKVKDIEWHDPEDALRLVDLSDVEFDDKTGAVKDSKKLVEAAKTLAKNKPHLVRSKTEPPQGTPSGRPSGKPPAGKPGKDGLSDEELLRKYNVQR